MQFYTFTLQSNTNTILEFTMSNGYRSTETKTKGMTLHDCIKDGLINEELSK